ncbi:MAG: hypothetical protein HND57_11585 [Planctomycetes bacterium]|nr:hypothetical protein [Planctomycetota bacterium]
MRRDADDHVVSEEIRILREHGTYTIQNDDCRADGTVMAQFVAGTPEGFEAFNPATARVQHRAREMARAAEKSGAPNPQAGGEQQQPENQWETASKWVDGWSGGVGKAVSLARAVGSKMIEGPAPLHVINFRHSCCYGTTIHGLPVNDKPCRGSDLKAEDGHDYCGSCGCGRRRLAQLDPRKKTGGAGDWTTSKLAYPALVCPLAKFGAVKGVNRAKF